MKKITLTTALGDTKDSHLRIRMGLKGTGAYDIEINIPFTLMFTDMFERGVLSPLSEQSFFTKDDDRTIIAYHYAHSMEQVELEPDFASIQDRIAVNLIIASVAYKALMELTDTFIANVLLEMEEGVPDFGTHIFFTELVEKCVPRVNSFMEDPLSKMSVESRIELYRSILKPYAALAAQAEQRSLKVDYHPEVLNNG